MNNSKKTAIKTFRLVFLTQEHSQLKELCHSLLSTMLGSNVDIIDLISKDFTFRYTTLQPFIDRFESLTEEELHLLKSFSLVAHRREVSQKVLPKGYTQIARTFLAGLGIKCYMVKFSLGSVFQIDSDALFEFYSEVTKP